jgi:hypothetical protein
MERRTRTEASILPHYKERSKYGGKLSNIRMERRTRTEASILPHYKERSKDGGKLSNMNDGEKDTDRG